MKKDIIKAMSILACGFTAIALFNKGVAEGRDLMAVIAVFIGIFAWGWAYKLCEGERDRKSGLDKAVRDELEEQRRTNDT